MDVSSGALVLAAGVGAGLLNAVVGSGTLLTFPTLLAVGVPPISANISNNVGLLGGGFSGAWGYRREVRGDRDLLGRLLPASVLGAAVGAVAVLSAPESVFAAVVPLLIALAVVLVILQPRLAAALTEPRRAATDPDAAPGEQRVPRWLPPSVFGAGMYGGYFGAAQGVLLIGMIGIAYPQNLQRVNGLKNVLTLAVNLVAALTFLIGRPSAINWVVVALIAAGSWVGGFLGARWGRQLSPAVLRAVVVIVGLIAVTQLVVKNAG